jgi:hypothetical protein
MRWREGAEPTCEFQGSTGRAPGCPPIEGLPVFAPSALESTCLGFVRRGPAAETPPPFHPLVRAALALASLRIDSPHSSFNTASVTATSPPQDLAEDSPGWSYQGHPNPLIPEPDDAPVKRINWGVELENSGVTLILNHGSMPAFSRKRRTSSRVALPVSRDGCGPWNCGCPTRVPLGAGSSSSALAGPKGSGGHSTATLPGNVWSCSTPF